MKQEYKVGDWVHVIAAVRFDYSYCDDRRWARIRRLNRKPCWFDGKIVGARYRQLGERVYHGQGTSFTQKGTQFVWLVSRGVTNAPVDVLPDDLERIDGTGRELPWRYVKMRPWPHKWFKELRHNNGLPPLPQLEGDDPLQAVMIETEDREE